MILYMLGNAKACIGTRGHLNRREEISIIANSWYSPWVTVGCLIANIARLKKSIVGGGGDRGWGVMCPISPVINQLS